jgi:hypothetical protein
LIVGSYWPRELQAGGQSQVEAFQCSPPSEDELNRTFDEAQPPQGAGPFGKNHVAYTHELMGSAPMNGSQASVEPLSSVSFPQESAAAALDVGSASATVSDMPTRKLASVRTIGRAINGVITFMLVTRYGFLESASVEHNPGSAGSARRWPLVVQPEEGSSWPDLVVPGNLSFGLWSTAFRDAKIRMTLLDRLTRACDIIGTDCSRDRLMRMQSASTGTYKDAV